VLGNVGATMMHPGRRQLEASGEVSIDIVTLEDLLYNLPDAERPRVSVRTLDSATGQHVTKLVPLRPEHIYVVKCDVEGFDVPVLHSLQRLFSAPLDSRPVALTLEFQPRYHITPKGCDAMKFTSFMYDLGYRYQHYTEALEWDKMSAMVEASREDAPGCIRVFEGWWKHTSLLGTSSSPASVPALPSIASASQSAPAPSPAQAALPASTAVTNAPTSTTPSSQDFCNITTVGERKLSVFHAAPPLDIRVASVNARSNNATATQVLASYLDALNSSYPCYWADYKIPSGHTVRMCTHDPKVDVGVSGRIHAGGAFFSATMFWNFLGSGASMDTRAPYRVGKLWWRTR
jgi:hypothetical protein